MVKEIEFYSMLRDDDGVLTIQIKDNVDERWRTLATINDCSKLTYDEIKNLALEVIEQCGYKLKE